MNGEEERLEEIDMVGESGPAALVCFGDCLTVSGLRLGVAGGDLAFRERPAGFLEVGVTFGEAGGAVLFGVDGTSGLSAGLATFDIRDSGGGNAVSNNFGALSISTCRSDAFTDPFLVPIIEFSRSDPLISVTFGIVSWISLLAATAFRGKGSAIS